jgi:hypothetical protein
LLAVLAGCGGPRSSPEGAVHEFLEALGDRDSARFEASFTEGTRRMIAEIESLSAIAQGTEGAVGLEDWCTAFCGGTVESSTLHGDSATVQVRVKENVEAIPVIRVEDGWRIDLTSRLDEAVQILRLAVSGVAPPAETLAVDTLEPADVPAADPAP